MADVVALDALGRSLETECVGELAQRSVGLPAVGEPADALLLERVLRVPLRELGEVTFLAALRDEDPNGAAATLGREDLECFRFRYRNRDDDLWREIRRDRVVLAQERREHVGRERTLRT